MIPVTADIALAEEELQFEFVRAAGPGGQNVNKVATAVQLRFDLHRSPSLPEAVRQRAERLAGKRLTADGILVITARQHRTQEANRQEALQHLVDLLSRAARPPKPRHKTQPTAASIERRLQSKKQRGLLKRQRQGRDDLP
jgi:ribosome-associated protein